MGKTDPGTIAWLLNLANDMRRHKNDQILTDLPASIPQDPSHCIIANAFNYGCTVMPENGVITFNSVEDRDVYFKVMGLNQADYIYEDDEYDEWDDELEYVHGELEAPMTSELVQIAEQFDNGFLFTEYVLKGSKFDPLSHDE